MERPAQRKLLKILLPALCLILIILHGMKDVFVVDAVTLGLLVLLALPYLQEITGSIKAGGVEITFRELSVKDQTLLYMDSVARHSSNWTFYPPRRNETELGMGLKFLIQNLLHSNKKELYTKIEEWLNSDLPNLKWLASEIIGYFRLDEFEQLLIKQVNKLDADSNWEDWQLNYLWAYSRMHNYKPLGDLLLNSKKEYNQNWALDAFEQMSRHDEKCRTQINSILTDYLNRPDINAIHKTKAQNIISNKPTP